MSTPTSGIFRPRWVSFLFGANWRYPMLDRVHRRIGGNGRFLVTSASTELVAFRLARNELAVLHECRGRRAIDVRQGVLWLTSTPASGDVILRRGDRFEFGNQWPFLVQALEDAEVELLH